MKMKQFILFCVLNAVLVSQAKHMDRCALATELLRNGFPQHQLKDWVCLVESESGGRTDVIGPPNSNGSRDHGLFQINDRYWCNNGSPGKDCNVKCEDLRTDDISAAAACAKKIYSIQGFNAWYGWKNKCKNKQISDLNNCIL